MQPSDNSGIWVSGAHKSPFGGRRSPGDKIRVLVVDDHEGFRKALRSTFELEPDMEIVGEATDGYTALEAFGRLKPDVVLMDMNMPGMGGMEATRKLIDSYPGVLVITLTMYKGEEHLREARRAGASAYVIKDAGSEVLLQTIRNVMQGENPILQRDSELSHTTTPLQPLTGPPAPGEPATGYLITSRERSVMAGLARNLTNDQIAQQIQMPVSMVRTYIEEICRKLGLSGRDAAARYARARGFGTIAGESASAHADDTPGDVDGDAAEEPESEG